MPPEDSPKRPPPPPLPDPPQVDWTAPSMHAYYAAAAAATGHPFPWPTQHMAGPYAAAIPYPPAAMYHPAAAAAAAAAYYAAAAAAAASGAGYVAAVPLTVVPEGKGTEKTSSSPERPDDGGKESSAAGSDSEGSPSENRRIRSAGLSEARDDSMELKDTPATKKMKLTNEKSSEDLATHYSNAVSEQPCISKTRSATKLPVSAPGRATLPDPATNLNLGMDIWKLPQPSSAYVSQQPVDEWELKREKRKQSNRESARRSRLRKQQECEELSKKVSELTSENSALKSELEQLKKACEGMLAENSRLTEEMGTSHVGTTIPCWAMQTEPTKLDLQSGSARLHHHLASSGSSSGSLARCSIKTEPAPRQTQAFLL